MDIFSMVMQWIVYPLSAVCLIGPYVSRWFHSYFDKQIDDHFDNE